MYVDPSMGQIEIYRGVHENMGGGVKIQPFLENNSAFESSHRVTCHVILRFT